MCTALHTANWDFSFKRNGWKGQSRVHLFRCKGFFALNWNEAKQISSVSEKNVNIFFYFRFCFNWKRTKMGIILQCFTFERKTDRYFFAFFALFASFCFPAIGTSMDLFTLIFALFFYATKQNVSSFLSLHPIARRSQIAVNWWANRKCVAKDSL